YNGKLNTIVASGELPDMFAIATIMAQQVRPAHQSRQPLADGGSPSVGVNGALEKRQPVTGAAPVAERELPVRRSAGLLFSGARTQQRRAAIYLVSNVRPATKAIEDLDHHRSVVREARLTERPIERASTRKAQQCFVVRLRHPSR